MEIGTIVSKIILGLLGGRLPHGHQLVPSRLVSTLHYKRELRAFAGLRRDHDFAAVQLGDVLYDGEAKPRASKRPAAILVNAVEAFKKMGLAFFGDSYSVVGYADCRLA